MEKRIPFELNLRPDIEAGKYKVVTRDGRSVRIICWDAKQHESEKFSFPIIALVERGKFEELSYNFTDKGRWSLHGDTALDLFLVPVGPEPELTWWEKKVKEEFDHYHKDSDDIKTCAAELMKAAIDYISKAAFTNVPALTNYYGLFNCRQKKEKEEPELTEFDIRLNDCMLAAQQYQQGKICRDVVTMWAKELLALARKQIEAEARPEPYDPRYDKKYLDAKIKKASESWKGVSGDKYLDEVRGGETLHWRKGQYYIPSGGAMCLIRTRKDTPDNGYMYYVEYRMDISKQEEFIPISEIENLKAE